MSVFSDQLEMNEVYEGTETQEFYQPLDLRSNPEEQIMDISGRNLTPEVAQNQTCDNIRQHRPKVLIMDHNKLTHFPKELCVPCIESLSLQSQLDPNQAWKDRWPALKILPEAMGNMTHLRELNLTNNALEDLPESLASLQLLTTVDLRLNYFRTFPKAVLMSRSICEVNLTGNYIKDLPIDICGMGQLQILILDNNDLSTLPEELHKLQNLSVLSVRNNKRLSRLPQKLHGCPSLREINVDGNPMEYPPEEVCRKGSKDILEYMKRKSDRRACKEDSVEGVCVCKQKV